jgi:streptogrisin C
MAPSARAVAVTAIAFAAVSMTPVVVWAAEEPAPAPSQAAPLKLDMAPGMLAALKRDLKLDDAKIATRLQVEAAAPVTEKRLKAELGNQFGGVWIAAGDDQLSVAVTTEAAAAKARAAGASPKLVARGLKDLDAARAKLDKRATKASKTIHSWRVDPATNAVVVVAAKGAEAAAQKFAKDSGAGAVRVETAAEQPRTAYDIRGGDQYVINGNTLCSVGFSVTAGGFVTAGHCGGAGSPTLGYNNVSQGNFAASRFPGADYAWVRTNGNWTPQPWVNNYSGGNVIVSGNAEAAIGASICRSGRTTQWQCGVLQGKNETVNYGGQVVPGLSRMNACANPGDSGGSVISGNQAQGVTSGIAGGCGSGNPQTWFQPVNPILSAYGLTLTTTGGGGGGGNALVSRWNGKCIDVPNGNFADGVQLQMWNCNGSAAQRFEFVNGTLRTGNNKCMDVAWGSRDNGAVIQIVGCSGNPAQQFVLSAAGDLVNPQANKCVDIGGWNGNDGAKLIQWECLGGANQKWDRR